MYLLQSYSCWNDARNTLAIQSQMTDHRVTGTLNAITEDIYKYLLPNIHSI